MMGGVRPGSTKTVESVNNKAGIAMQKRHFLNFFQIFSQKTEMRENNEFIVAPYESRSKTY